MCGFHSRKGRVVSCLSHFLRSQHIFSSTAQIGRTGVERTLRTEELARDVEGLTSHNDDLLAVEQLLSDSAGQATKEVSLAVDDDL